MKFVHKCVTCAAEATKKSHSLFVCDRCAKAMRKRYRHKPAKRPRFALKEFLVHSVPMNDGNLNVYAINKVRLH